MKSHMATSILENMRQLNSAMSKALRVRNSLLYKLSQEENANYRDQLEDIDVALGNLKKACEAWSGGKICNDEYFYRD